MYQKKFTIRILAILIVLVSASIIQVTIEPLQIAKAQGNTALTIEPAVSNVLVGEVFDVTVRVETDGQAVNAASASLTFDPTKLEVQTFTDGTPLSEFQSDFDNTLGTFDYVALDENNSPPTTSFDLVVITFEALDTSTGTPLEFVDITPGGGSDLAFGGNSVLDSTSNGEVVIEAQAETPNIIINEIMQNPDAVDDSDGEWFELYNPESYVVDINGWTIEDNGTNSHTISNGGPLNIPAGGYLVLGRNSDSVTNGDVAVDYQYSSFILGNEDDEVVLLDANLDEIDRVEYDDGVTFPDPTGASMSLADISLDNNVGTNWCTSTTPFGDGDLGTPGAANNCDPTGTLTVVKDVVPNDAGTTWQIDITGPTVPPSDALNGDDTTDVLVVNVGNYDISELGISGTMLNDYNSTYECTLNGDSTPFVEGDGPVIDDVPVGEGEDVVCTFTNTLIITLAYAAGTGGTVDGDTSQVVNYGEDGTPVEAIPDTGYHFVEWSDGATDNPRTDTNVTADVNVTATFEENPSVQYNVSVTGIGNGTVNNTPGNPYPAGAIATLKPIAYPGWSFDGWSGPDAGELSDNGNGTWSLVMDSDKSVTATFTEDEYDVTVTEVGDGVVNNTPGNPYTYNEIATLEPIAAPGWSFDGWSGPDAGELSDNGDGTWDLLMNGDKNITATFTEDTPTPTTQIYVSSNRNGYIDDFFFADEDILAFNPDTESWSLYFDGSDVGLGRRVLAPFDFGVDLDAFYILDDGNILLSLDRPKYIDGIGWVDDSDIIKFIPTLLGTQTSGSFELYFDGSDVGLFWGSEDIDAIGFTPTGELVISTIGPFGVPGVGGRDEDLIIFTPTSLGQNTRGTWKRYFDGSDVGLRGIVEDVHGVWIDDTDDIYLTTKGHYFVPGLSGDGADIFICTPTSLGIHTSCTFSLFWSGSANGFAGYVVDAFTISDGPAIQTDLVSAAVKEDILALEDEDLADEPEEEDIAADDIDDEDDTDDMHDLDDISTGADDKGSTIIFLPLIFKD